MQWLFIFEFQHAHAPRRVSLLFVELEAIYLYRSEIFLRPRARNFPLVKGIKRACVLVYNIYISACAAGGDRSKLYLSIYIWRPWRVEGRKGI